MGCAPHWSIGLRSDSQLVATPMLRPLDVVYEHQPSRAHSLQKSLFCRIASRGLCPLPTHKRSQRHLRAGASYRAATNNTNRVTRNSGSSQRVRATLTHETPEGRQHNFYLPNRARAGATSDECVRVMKVDGTERVRRMGRSGTRGAPGDKPDPSPTAPQRI